MSQTLERALKGPKVLSWKQMEELCHDMCYEIGVLPLSFNLTRNEKENWTVFKPMVEEWMINESFNRVIARYKENV